MFFFAVLDVDPKPGWLNFRPAAMRDFPGTPPCNSLLGQFFGICVLGHHPEVFGCAATTRKGPGDFPGIDLPGLPRDMSWKNTQTRTHTLDRDPRDIAPP